MNSENILRALDGKPHEAMSLAQVMEAMATGGSYIAESGYIEEIIRLAKVGQAGEKSALSAWAKAEAVCEAIDALSSYQDTVEENIKTRMQAHHSCLFDPDVYLDKSRKLQEGVYAALKEWRKSKGV